MRDFAAEIREQGFGIRRGVVVASVIEGMRASLPVVPSGGVRNALAVSEVLAELARTATVRLLASAVLGERARVTRAILFDKTKRANWRVPWHQDTTIAVRHRVETPGFGPWSVKDGVVHVKPPAAVLESVLTLRLHLDPCDESNGPLVVLPGSHLEGFLNEAQARTLMMDTPSVTCVAGIGDVVAFRPLLMHSSQKSAMANHRRVLHLEFAAGRPAESLEWNEADPDCPPSADR